jgi:hypothetical protein
MQVKIIGGLLLAVCSSFTNAASNAAAKPAPMAAKSVNASKSPKV